MTEQNDELSGIRRNVDSIHERRRRLRALEEMIETGATPAGHSSRPSPILSGDSAPTNLATANARMTARVAQVLDRFGEAVVEDITGAAERTARLPAIGSDIARIAGREKRQPEHPITDVEVVETSPEKSSST